MLPFAISFQGFQLIARGYTQILQDCRPVNLLKFAKGRSLYVCPTRNALTEEERLRILAFEALDRHVEIITTGVNNVKREYLPRESSSQALVGQLGPPAEEFQCLGIGQPFEVLDQLVVYDVAHGEFDDLA